MDTKFTTESHFGFEKDINFNANNLKLLIKLYENCLDYSVPPPTPSGPIKHEKPNSSLRTANLKEIDVQIFGEYCVRQSYTSSDQKAYYHFEPNFKKTRRHKKIKQTPSFET